MNITYTSIIYNLLISLGFLLLSILLFYNYKFGYWKRRGLEYLPASFPFGNVSEMMLQKFFFGEQFAVFYRQFKKKQLRHGGAFMFTNPCYIPVDLDIIKDILIKDFSHFVDRGFYVNEENDPISGHLFNLEGHKWHNLRTKLSTAYTSGKIKMMFDTVIKIANNLETIIDDTYAQGPIQARDILQRYTIDVISSCAFGLESKALSHPQKNKFKVCASRIVEHTTFENLKILCAFSLPKFILDLLKLKVNKTDVIDFFLNTVKNTVRYREENNIYRKDFLHLLLQLKNRGKLSDDKNIINHTEALGEHTININEITAQVFVFFLAGFETSTSAMTFAMYELSKHQEIQNKLRKEIQEVLANHNNQLTYEAIKEMTYLDQVINETLRKYPPIPMLNRICTKDYKVRDSNVTIGKDTIVVIPIIAIQNDPEYFPNPEVFDPERFNEKNKQTINPMTFMPFGNGPRNCIGMRFGWIQSKVGLVSILRNHRTTLNKKTIEPIVLDPRSFTIASHLGIYIDFQKIE